MSILTHLNNLKSSTIYKLQFNNKIVGLRVKYYSLSNKCFSFYDFEISYIQSQDLRSYLSKNSKNFEKLELIEYNNLICTQDEIDGIIKVQEFKDVKSAEEVLQSVIGIMEV